MGGKSSSGGDAVIKEQKAQATEARQKEVDRQARLQQGLANIRAAFEGGQQTQTTNGTYQVGSGPLPAGYTYVAAPAAAAPAASPPTNRGGVGYNSGREQFYSGTGGTATGGSSMANTSRAPAAAAAPAAPQMVRGPDGTLYKVGDKVNYTSTTNTGNASAGFGDAFYDKFRKSILDYFNPQVAEQYKEAQDQTNYGLARAGTLRSSTAIDEAAKLAEQNRLNMANVQTQADTGAADLRSRVASERSKAESQLYATEDPTVAANQALAAVRNISLDTPDLSPLAEVFKVAALGGANALSGYKNQQNVNDIRRLSNTGTRIV